MIRDKRAFRSVLRDLRSWVQKAAIPREDEFIERDYLPDDLVADMAEQGFFGWSIPEEFRGSGFTTEELILAAMELSYAATAIRARVGTNTGIGSEAILVDGTEDQKRRFLPRLASGEITGCFALTELEAGSDAAAIKTTARLDGDDFIIEGTKTFITNAPISDLFTVFARTDPDDPTHPGISAFLVERDTPGLETGSPGR